MNHFVNVTFQIPEHVAEQWVRAVEQMIKVHAKDNFGAVPIKVEPMGTDEMPDRCEKTQDMPFMNEEGKA